MTKEQIKEMLPHGSGIDLDWEIEETEAGDAWVASNAYHLMDEAGMYVDWKQFEVWIPRENPLEFELDLDDDDSGLWEYLDQTIFWSIGSWLSRNDMLVQGGENEDSKI